METSKKRKACSTMSIINSNEMCTITIDNSEIVLKTMHSLYTNNLMCDVYLKVGGRTYTAHRLILCAMSDVFQAMLMKPEWSEWSSSEIELKELPITEPYFEYFLEYFYTGKILINHMNVLGILCLADKYIVKSLTTLCCEYMTKHIQHAASSNVLLSWLQYSLQCDHTSVSERCLSYIKWNLEAIANSPEFTEFDVGLITCLLKMNDLVVYNEMVLFNILVRWLELQKIHCKQAGMSPMELLTFIRNLVRCTMDLIRFPMMTPLELADLLTSSLLPEHKEFFVDRLRMGMLFHNGYKEQLKTLVKNETNRELFVPRLYTCDRFNCKLLIENFHTVPDYHMSTFLFSTLTSGAEVNNEQISEWIVDLYPKGVHFEKCFLIVWQGMLELPEQKLNNLRLSLTLRGEPKRHVRVRIGILMYANDGYGCEYVVNVIERYFHFTQHERVLNIENFIPFDELSRNKYLVGANNDQLKINLVITPTYNSEFSDHFEYSPLID